MDTPDLDEEEKARRKAESIAYRNKKRYSSIFMLCASVFEILESLAIMFVMFFIAAFFIFRVFKATGPTGQVLFQVLMILIFISGLILGFLVYKKTVTWVIKKYKLEDKLLDEVLLHYTKKDDLEEKLRR